MVDGVSGAWPLLGRGEQLRQAADSIDSGTCLVITGAAGIGKSRLLEEIVARVDRGRFAVQRLLPTDATAAIPLGAFAPLLPKSLAQVEHPWLLLRDAAAAVSSGADRVTLLAIDDVQFLDELSVALVAQLVLNANTVLVLTCRTGAVLPPTIAELVAKRPSRWVSLGALSEHEVRAALTTALDGPVEAATARACRELSLGNPLYLREIVRNGCELGTLRPIRGVWRRTGSWQVPPGLLELIRSRVERLDPAERRVAELLAFAGELDVSTVALLDGRQVLPALEAKGLLSTELVPDGQVVRPSHPLHAEAIRALTPPQRAAQRRRELADVAERLGEENALRVAVWRLDAGDPVGVERLLLACRFAWAALDMPLLRRLAEAAVAEGDSVKATQMLADALVYLGHADEADKVLARAGASPRTDEERLLLAMSRAFTQFWGFGRSDKAIAVLDGWAPRPEDPAVRRPVDFLRGQVLALSGDPKAALRHYRPLLADRALRDHPWTAPMWVVAAIAEATLGHPDRSAAAVSHARRSTSGTPLPWSAPALHWSEYIHLAMAGEYGRAGEVAAALRAEAEDDGPFCGLGSLACGQAARLRGDLASARGYLAEATYEHQRSVTDMPSIVAAELAHTAALAGDRVAADAAMREALMLRRRCLALLERWLDVARTWTMVFTDSVEAAAAHSVRCAATARTDGLTGFEIIALHDAVRLGTVTSAVVDRLTELGEHHDFANRAAEHAIALARHNGPALTEVAEGFLAAGAVLLAAEAFAGAEAAYGASGDEAAQRNSRARAALLRDRCGAACTPALQRLRAPMLTPREREIAALAAEGLGNRQIAEQLCVSIRTIENHLQRIYQKLGVANRGHLARFLSSAE